MKTHMAPIRHSYPDIATQENLTLLTHATSVAVNPNA
jgi:hypothetical protein